MIYGIGTDIVYIPRIANAYTRFGQAFAERILTADELVEFRQSRKPTAFLATRFAVKEAAAKAFGTGFRQGLSFKHIGVQYDALRKPCLIFLERAAEWVQEKKISYSHVSIAGEADYAIAYVVLEGNA